MAEINFEQDPTTQDAMARLEQAEAAEPAPKPEREVQTDTEAEPVAAPEGDKAETPKETPSETPADAKTPPVDTKKEPKKPAKDDPTRSNDSKFAADAIRKDKSWKALESEKESFRKEQESLVQQKQQLEQQTQAFQQRQAKANNRYTPEQYEQAAKNKVTEAEQLSLEADGLERRADKLDESGQAGQAELARQQAAAKRKAATGAEAIADQYKNLAEHTRKNPDPTVAQIQKQNQDKIQAYTIEAAKQWPDLAVKDSPLQKATSKILIEARQNGLDEMENPTIRYHAVRLAAAELASARVSGLEKELGEAQAKVKELEALTAVGGGQGAVQAAPSDKGFDDMSAEEQHNALRTQAASF